MAASSARQSQATRSRVIAPYKHHQTRVNGGTLSQIAPGDFDVAVIGQLPTPQLALGNPLKSRAVEVVGFDAALRGRPVGQQALEYAPPHPNQAAVFPISTPNCTAWRSSSHQASSGKVKNMVPPAWHLAVVLYPFGCRIAQVKWPCKG
jgi:hypothetical protein